MFLDIHQNSTFNIINSSDTDDYFTMCKDMYEGVVFWACFSLVSVVFGIPASVSVLWELLQRHSRGVPATPNDVFMLNLTVMDLVFLTFTPLGVINHVLFWYIWLIEDIFNFIYAFTMTGRPLFMTCICLECYLAVVHPIKYRTRNSLMPRVLISIGVWVITLVYGALYARFNIAMIKNPVSILPYVLTILTIGICDFFILRALKSSEPGGRDLHPQKKKALQIIVNSLVMTVIAYFPPILITSFSTLMPDNVLICRLFYTMSCSINAGSTIMPVLHLSNLKNLDSTSLLCCKTVRVTNQ